MATADEHPAVEALADHAAGLPTSVDVARHLAGCPDCQDAAAALERTTAALVGLGDVTMPDDVGRRLESRIGAPATVTTLAERRRRPGLAGITAVAVGLALVGGVIAGVLASQRATPTNPGAARAAAPQTASGQPLRVTASGRGYTLANLTASIPAVLAAQRAAGGVAAVGTVPATLQPFLSEPVSVRNCLNDLAGGPSFPPLTPLAIDLGTWYGRPAAVIVVVDPHRTALADVYVEGPSCAQGVDHLYRYQVVTRPTGF